ncbi:hypothetical protein AVEN_154054-1 [Araneus ventricosus]|uniref:Uncharacterized protein n=2 Tax=Araneus ventricosus TaxID=182803 RepID=A0A4Y2NIU7_ARAVE|nr:hypothetical protein AVEN_154054-1 [Araneus ventricosus]
MDKRFKTGTRKRSISRTEIRTTDLTAIEITVDQQGDNHEVQKPTYWPAQVRNKIDFAKKSQNISAVILNLWAPPLGVCDNTKWRTRAYRKENIIEKMINLLKGK